MAIPPVSFALQKFFFLKGAMLFVLWESRPHRPTRDMDLLFLQQHDARELKNIFKEVALTEVIPDGLIFDPESIHATDIREDNVYGGIRVKMTAYLGTGRIAVQVDIGLGDAVHPQPQWTELTPILLHSPAPRIRPYPIHTVVAEKFQAMVELGESNSRMKDYYDINYMLGKFRFKGYDIREAIHGTFERRKTVIPDSLPSGLSSAFSENQQKRTQWNAFLRKNRLDTPSSLPEVITAISIFLMPVATDPGIIDKDWLPGNGWILQGDQ
jgi:hypothetical protein